MDLGQQIQDSILDALQHDELILPTLPETALRAREAAENPNVSAPQLANVIANDAALTARVIKVANSPQMRSVQTVTDPQMAISRIGIVYACNLITGLAMEQMFQATTPFVDKLLRKTWQHSTEVAGIASVLCRHYSKHLKPDQATLAGLIHEIGILPILTYAEENEGILEDTTRLSQVIQNIHPIIGGKILSVWDFPEELRSVPGEYLNFDYKNSASESSDYVDVVTVANLQSYVDSNHPLAYQEWADVSAFQHLGLDTEIESCEGVDIAEEIADAKQLLH